MSPRLQQTTWSYRTQHSISYKDISRFPICVTALNAHRARLRVLMTSPLGRTTVMFKNHSALAVPYRTAFVPLLCIVSGYFALEA